MLSNYKGRLWVHLNSLGEPGWEEETVSSLNLLATVEMQCSESSPSRSEGLFSLETVVLRGGHVFSPFSLESQQHLPV